MEGWELARNNFRLVERRPHSSSEDCEIDTQHNQSTSLFEITYTLLTLLGFFWDSVFFGIPRSARTHMLSPEGSGMHILAPNCGSGMILVKWR